MSNYVFQDSSRKIILYAKDCDSSNLDIEYFCPTPNCPANLTLKSLNGKRNSYFSALPSKPHDPRICAGGKIQGKKANYDVSNFSIHSLYDLIIRSNRESSSSGSGSHSGSSSSETESEQINTLSKLYYFCKGHDINYIIKDGLAIKDLIADSRTNYIFTNNIRGLRLVEVTFHRYIDRSKSIEFSYPIDSSLPNKHKLTVTFENDKDYSKIISKLFKEKDYHTKAIIGILGDWTNNTCIISHYKQIIII